MASYWRQNIVIFDNFDKFQPIFVILTSFGWINHLKRWNKLVYVSYRSNGKQLLPLKISFLGLITSYWRQNDVILDSFYQFEPIYVILTTFVWFDHLKSWNKLVNDSYTSKGKQLLPIKRSLFGLMTSYWCQNDVNLDNFDQFEPICVILTSFVWFDPLKRRNKLVPESCRSS